MPIQTVGSTPGYPHETERLRYEVTALNNALRLQIVATEMALSRVRELEAVEGFSDVSESMLAHRLVTSEKENARKDFIIDTLASTARYVKADINQAIDMLERSRPSACNSALKVALARMSK